MWYIILQNTVLCNGGAGFSPPPLISNTADQNQTYYFIVYHFHEQKTIKTSGFDQLCKKLTKNSTTALRCRKICIS